MRWMGTIAVLVCTFLICLPAIAEKKKPPKLTWGPQIENDDWKQVRITSDSSASRDCSSSGTVYAKIYRLHHKEVTADMVYNELKNKAAGKKANLVVLIGPAAEVGQTASDKGMEATGEAFTCGEGIVSNNKPSAEGTPCGDNFESSGSALRGSTFVTFTETPGVTVAEAVRRIAARLPEDRMTVLSADERAGTISAEQEAERGAPVPVTIAVTPSERGVRAEMSVKLRPFLMTNREHTRDVLCSVLASVAGRSSERVVKTNKGDAPKTVGAGKSVEERLQELEDLYKKKIISKAEYEQKRAAILKDL